MFRGVSLDSSSPGRCAMTWRNRPTSDLTLKLMEVPSRTRLLPTVLA